jgi:integrase
MVSLGIYTALRIGDILKLKCDDVFDFNKKRVRKFIHLTESKTKKTKSIKVHPDLKKALETYFPQATTGKPLLLNTRTGKAISRIQAYRIIRCAAESMDIPHGVSCHSLRKTFGYHSWKNGISPAIITEIYNHSDYSTTRRYIGVNQDDKNTAYNNLTFL